MSIVETYQTEMEILSNWLPLIKAAGLLRGDITAAEAFELSGRILRDEILFQHTKPFLDSDGPNARIKALTEMSEADRAALRERVLGVIPIRKVGQS